MPVSTSTCTVQTRGQGDVQDITQQLADALAGSALRDGVATVAVIGSTAAITTIEFESGAVSDFDRLLQQLAPHDAEYAHHARWGDDNGSSHVRAALIGPSVSLPFRNGDVALGTWQQLVVVECDTRPRTREVVFQMLGE